MKHPVYISVDTEFTDGNLVHGQMTQIGMVGRLTGRVTSAVVPITLEARVNPWVRENLNELVTAALRLSLDTNHFPTVHVGDHKVPSGLMSVAGQLQTWVYSERMEAFFRHHEVPVEKRIEAYDPGQMDNFPAVMVTYCGGCDFGFINKLFATCGISNPFHYEMVDIASLALALGYGWDARSRDIEAGLGLPPADEDKLHDALYDAQRQLAMFNAMLEHIDNLKETLHDQARCSHLP